MKIEITKRDRKLFQIIHDFGILSTCQINSLVFPGVNYRTVLRRLRRLEKSKYLIRTRFYKGGAATWYLTKFSATLLGVKKLVKSFNKNTLEHDLKANDLRISLSKLKCFSSWVSSHQLKQSLGPNAPTFGNHMDTIPDWICKAQGYDETKTVAIELELSWKGIRRMRHLFHRYLRKDSLTHLWYFVPTKTYGRRLSKMAKEFNLNQQRGPHWFMWSLLEDYLENPFKGKIYLLDGTHLPKKFFYMPAHTSAHLVSRA